MVNKHYYKNFRLLHSWYSGTLAINVIFSATAIVITKGSSKWLMNETEGTSRLRHKGWDSKGNGRPLLDRIQVLCISISRSNRCSDDDPEANGN